MRYGPGAVETGIVHSRAPVLGMPEAGSSATTHRLTSTKLTSTSQDGSPPVQRIDKVEPACQTDPPTGAVTVNPGGGVGVTVGVAVGAPVGTRTKSSAVSAIRLRPGLVAAWNPLPAGGLTRTS